MADHRVLYEKVILDHNKSPRNWGTMENPDHKAEGYNALCGDQFTIYMKMDGDIISEISFEGAGDENTKRGSTFSSRSEGRFKTDAPQQRRSARCR